MKVYIALANGFEESEAILPYDILCRAGIETVWMSISSELEVVSTHGLCIRADVLLSDTDTSDGDMIFLPGGMPGSSHLAECKALATIISDYHNQGKYLAAICAAPMVYGLQGLLKGKNATCYPGFEEELTGANVTYNRCEADGNIITSRGMGCAIDFSLKIIKKLENDDTASKIGRQIIYF